MADVARTSGCRLQEYENARATNPPVTGRRVERTIATDGSYIGRAAPSIDSTIHSLLHGRVLIQYRSGLPEPEVRVLDRLVKDDPDRVVGFENHVSLAVIASAAAVAIGADIADPLIGLAITLVILRITWQSWRTVRHHPPG